MVARKRAAGERYGPQGRDIGDSCDERHCSSVCSFARSLTHAPSLSLDESNRAAACL